MRLLNLITKVYQILDEKIILQRIPMVMLKIFWMEKNRK